MSMFLQLKMPARMNMNDYIDTYGTQKDQKQKNN